MKRVYLLVLVLFLGTPAFGQGLTINLMETDSTGKKSAEILQTDRTRARLDLPNGSKLLYNSETKKLMVMFPGSPTYVELTPQLVQVLGASRRGQAPPAAITYKRMGMSRVGQWPCTLYEGSRGSEKVAELCAAESAAIGLAASDFTVVQQALDSVKGVIPQDVLEGVPTYGSIAAQGFAGFPVRRVTFATGKVSTTNELVDIKRGPLPDANFAAPTSINNDTPAK